LVHKPRESRCPIRRRRKEARPSEILAAARAVFLENGFALAKVEEIARLAGVSKGTVYLYFPTKEALFEEMVRADFLPLIERLTTLVMADPDMSAIDQLRLIGDTMYREIAGTDRRLITHLVIAEGPRFPWLTEFYHREIMGRGKALIRAVLERGEARGEFHADGLKAYPEILMAPTIVGALFAILFSRHEPFDMNAFRAAHIDFALKALGSGKPEAER
jgi:AcrR family transcriptional regulator